MAERAPSRSDGSQRLSSGRGGDSRRESGARSQLLPEEQPASVPSVLVIAVGCLCGHQRYPTARACLAYLREWGESRSRDTGMWGQGVE